MISFTLGLIFLDGWTEFLSVLAGMIELAYVISWLNWRNDTKEMPKIHYRAFRRIERVAPDKWKPRIPRGVFGAKPHVPGTVCYDISGRDMEWKIIRMKTFPEALIFELGYHRRYRKRERKRVENNELERCLKSWQKDLDDYKSMIYRDKLKAVDELRFDWSGPSKKEAERLKNAVKGWLDSVEFRLIDDGSGAELHYRPGG